MKIHSKLRPLAGPVFCALLALPLVAGPGPGKGGLGMGGYGGIGSGNDDIGTLPSTLDDDAPSLMLCGTPEDLSDALLSLSGPGQVYAHSLDPWGERLLLELEGSMHAQLDSEAVASGRVVAWFHSGTTFAGALGLNQMRELDLETLAHGASMTVSNRYGQTFGLASRSTADGVLHLRQRLR